MLYVTANHIEINDHHQWEVLADLFDLDMKIETITINKRSSIINIDTVGRDS